MDRRPNRVAIHAAITPTSPPRPPHQGRAGTRQTGKYWAGHPEDNQLEPPQTGLSESTRPNKAGEKVGEWPDALADAGFFERSHVDIALLDRDNGPGIAA